jgi:hypothetical protein
MLQELMGRINIILATWPEAGTKIGIYTSLLYKTIENIIKVNSARN